MVIDVQGVAVSVPARWPKYTSEQKAALCRVVQGLADQYGDRLVSVRVDRYKNKTAKKRILAAKQVIEDEHAAQLTELRNGQPSVSTPEWIAQSVGFMVERLFEEAPDAENYFEMDVRNPDTGRKFVVTVAKSDRQLPSEMHRRAKAEIERLNARIAELEAGDG